MVTRKRRSVCPVFRPARGRSGLALTELLIVIAVIAILAAIILPCFFTARRKAAVVVCASNMHQLGLAFEMYAQDWNDYWPSPGGLPGNFAYWSQTGLGGLEQYVRQSGIGSVWCCPEVKEWHGRFPARTYSMNSYLRTPLDVEYPACLSFLCGISLKAIDKPERTVLLFEGVTLTAYFQDGLDYLYRCANWTRVRGFAWEFSIGIDSGRPWHVETNNYLYCDGHVKSRRPGRKTVGQLSTWREMYEWYVDKEVFVARYGEEHQIM